MSVVNKVKIEIDATELMNLYYCLNGNTCGEKEYNAWLKDKLMDKLITTKRIPLTTKEKELKAYEKRMKNMKTVISNYIMCKDRTNVEQFEKYVMSAYNNIKLTIKKVTDEEINKCFKLFGLLDIIEKNKIEK